MSNKSYCKPVLSEDFEIQEGLWEIDEEIEDKFYHDGFNDYYEYQDYDIDFCFMKNELSRYDFCIDKNVYKVLNDVNKYDVCYTYPNKVLFGFVVHGTSRYSYYYNNEYGVQMTWSYYENFGGWVIDYEYFNTLRSTITKRDGFSPMWGSPMTKTFYEEEMTPEIQNKYINMFMKKVNTHKRMLLRSKIKSIGRMK